MYGVVQAAEKAGADDLDSDEESKAAALQLQHKFERENARHQELEEASRRAALALSKTLDTKASN